MSLRGVRAQGEVRLLGAKLGGDLICAGGVFRAEKDAQGKSGKALDLSGAIARGVFFSQMMRRFMARWT